MTALADLIVDAKTLSRRDKLRLIRVLADDLTADDLTADDPTADDPTAAEGAVRAGQSYPVWSPEGAFDAADVLLRALAAEARP